METRTVTREVVSLSRGARIAVLAGLLLIVVATFLLFVPLEKGSSSGQPFRCGSAVNPENGDFAKAVCGGLATRFRLEAGAFAIGAIIVAAGGLWVFGVVRRLESREVRDYDDE